MEDQTMMEAMSCARMIIAAKAQAYEEAIRLLEFVEKYGARVLPKVLDDLRAKHAALAREAKETPSATPATEEEPFNGVLRLDDAAFERFIKIMENPGPPTAGAIRGAEQLRRLYGPKRNPQ